MAYNDYTPDEHTLLRSGKCPDCGTTFIKVDGDVICEECGFADTEERITAELARDETETSVAVDDSQENNEQ